MANKVIQWLEKHNKPYRLEKGGREAITLCKDCPPGKDHKLSINTLTSAYHCLRCGPQKVKGCLFTATSTKVRGEAPTPGDHEERSPRLNIDYIIALAQQTYLPGGREGLEYLYGRGLNDETIQRFNIGVDFNNHVIALPSVDPSGAVFSLKYRGYKEDLKSRYYQETLGEKALPYNIGGLTHRNGGVLLVTEGEFDALSLAQLAPDVDVIGICGMNAGESYFPKNKKEDTFGIYPWLKDYRQIFLFPDYDTKSKIQFRLYAERLGDHRCTVVELPLDKDINEAMIEGRLTSETLEEYTTLTALEGKPAFTSVSSTLPELKQKICEQEKCSGYTTGFKNLDAGLGGVRAGELTVVYGPPKSGKSSVCFQMAWEFMDQGVPCLLASLEMKRSDVLARYLSLASGRNFAVMSNLESLFKYPDPKRLDNAYWLLPGQAEASLLHVESAIKLAYRKEQLDSKPLVVVLLDHLSKVPTPANLKGYDLIRHDERQIAAIKNLTREFPNMWFILVAQPNAEGQVRGTRLTVAESDNVIHVESDGATGAKIKLTEIRSLAGIKNHEFKCSYDRETTRIIEEPLPDDF